MSSPEPGEVRLGLRPWHGVVFFLAAMGCQFGIFALIVVLQLTGVLGLTQAQVEAAMYSPGMLAAQVAATCAVLVLLALAGARLRKNLGVARLLRLRRPPRAAAVVAVVGVIPAGIVIDQVTFWLHSALPGVFDSAGLGTFVQIFAGASTAGFLVSTVVVSVGPALGEELFFRGLMLRAFSGGLSRWGAVVVSSILFGAMHLDLLQGTGAGLIGAYLGFVVLVTDSIWPAVLAHGLNNLLCSVFARLDPGGIGQAFSVGHPLWLVGTAALVLGGPVWCWGRLRVPAANNRGAPAAAAR
jgi:membrane protease YdiL (CAAX protease family)